MPPLLLIVSLATGYGGAERSIEVLLQHVPEQVRVRIYAEAPEHLAQLACLDRRDGRLQVQALAGTATSWGRKRLALRLAYDVWRLRPSAVLINTHASALVAAMAARLVPELGRICHLYVRDFLWTDLDLIFARLRGARVLVPSQSVLQRLGYLTPAYVAPWGPALATVMPCMVPIPSGPFGYGGDFLHLATVNPWKGHLDLMLALRQLMQRQPASDLRIHSCGVTGNLRLRQDLEQLVGRLGLEGRFELSPYTPDPGALLRNCRAVLVPSVSHSGGPETFGRSVIEAWAWRKPVIAYATGAPAQMIRHGVDGLLVPEGDLEALAQAMWQLHESPELCRRLGEAGHLRAMTEFEAALVTRRLLAHLGFGPDTLHESSMNT